MPIGEVIVAMLDQTYHALADSSRRAILRRLAKTDGLSVSELARPLPIALPTVMKHLDVLARAGFVERRKVGRIVTVRLRSEPMAEAKAWIEKTEAFWSGRLTRLAKIVEENDQ